MRRSMALAVGLCLLLARAPVADGEERVPLAENFPTGERVLVWSVVGLDVGLLIVQKTGLITHDPLIGEPGPFDVRVSDALYSGGSVEQQWLGGAPDLAGDVLAPYLSLAYYGTNAAVRTFRGRSLTGNVNADHEFYAYLEAWGLNFGLTQTVKLAVGRERPMYALDRTGAPPPGDDSNLSFFSGHSSSSFCLAAFITRDLTDWLVSGPLSGHPHSVRLVLGRLLPGVLLYGMAGTIALSRVIDQRHYLSDVLVGGLVGTTSGNLFYALHFDTKGAPRRYRPSVAVAPFPGGLALAGRF